MSIQYLKRKLYKKRRRVRTRYKYYEQKEYVPDLGISTPPQLRALMGTLGWCSKAVDCLSDRLIFDGFGDDILKLNDIYNLNNKDILATSAINSALIASCAFLYISQDDNGQPKLKVIDGAHASGILDNTTQMLKEGYAVLDYDEHDRPLLEAYFTPGNTDYFINGEYYESVPNICSQPLLVPLIYQSDAVRPFGHSRITRTCMALMDEGVRLLKRSSIANEFFSFPQKYALGVSEKTQEQMDSWAAAMSAMMTLTTDEDGQKPSVGQFSMGSMQPHTDELKMLCGQFCAETGLTLDDLGIPSSNPSSAESIKATHETLRLKARAAQRDFSVGFKNAGYLAACIRDNTNYDLQSLQNITTKWEPIFEPDYAALASIGDALYKIAQVNPNFISDDTIQALTGLKPKEATDDLFDPARIDAELELDND